VYSIVNIRDFSEAIRKEVLKTYSCADSERYLTKGQIVSFIKERFPLEDGEIVFDEDGLQEIIEFAVSAMLGSCMSEMASEGELECAWDEKQNDMVWWLPKKDSK
jgi:hypothetical protein